VADPEHSICPDGGVNLEAVLGVDGVWVDLSLWLWLGEISRLWVWGYDLMHRIHESRTSMVQLGNKTDILLTRLGLEHWPSLLYHNNLPWRRPYDIGPPRLRARGSR
jgi:hypothetical protein